MSKTVADTSMMPAASHRSGVWGLTTFDCKTHHTNTATTSCCLPCGHAAGSVLGRLLTTLYLAMKHRVSYIKFAYLTHMRRNIREKIAPPPHHHHHPHHRHQHPHHLPHHPHPPPTHHPSTTTTTTHDPTTTPTPPPHNPHHPHDDAPSLIGTHGQHRYRHHHQYHDS